MILKRCILKSVSLKRLFLHISFKNAYLTLVKKNINWTYFKHNYINHLLNFNLIVNRWQKFKEKIFMHQITKYQIFYFYLMIPTTPQPTSLLIK